MIVPLYTPRLLLQPLTSADAEPVQRLFPQWEIVRYLANVVPWPYPPDGALSYHRDLALPAMERGEEWHWTLRLRTAPEAPIGAIGLVAREDNNRGFWIAPAFQGQGLMTEAANAANDYWFDVLGFSRLRVVKAAANTASSRISQRQGMRLIERIEKDYVSGRLPSEVWEITAEEWHLHRSSR